MNLFGFNPQNLHGFNSYLCNVNDNVASIFLDFDLKKRVPIKNYSKLVWYWMKMKNPREDRLSSNKDFDDLLLHEEKLMKFLSNYPIIFAGTITTLGRKEFYFYTKEDIDFEGIIKEFIGEEEVYKFLTDEQKDLKWEQYLNILYPNTNQIEEIKQRKK